MEPPHSQPYLHLPKTELDRLLKQAAEQGAHRVLQHIGLESPDAARDIHELRDLLDAWRDARRTAWQTFVRVTTAGVLAAILLGVAIHLKQS